MYNEEEMADRFFCTVNKIISEIKSYKFEIIAINDGSTDKTLSILKNNREKQLNIGIINFSRNFGHESALTAGLESANGDAIIVMDADLQDPPEIIPNMIDEWEKGFDVVNAKRSSRKEDSLLKRWTAKKFYSTVNKLSGKVKIPENVGNYRLLDRKIVDEVNSLPERNRVFRILIPYLGYKTTEIEFERPKRAAGTTHYNWKSMFEEPV